MHSVQRYRCLCRRCLCSWLCSLPSAGGEQLENWEGCVKVFFVASTFPPWASGLSKIKQCTHFPRNVS
jgi:hypothetical protein